MDKANNKYKYCRRYCIVPQCQSTAVKTPEKIFMCLPVGSKNLKRRILWLQAMKRDIHDFSEKTRGYVCQDHFNLEEDAENYMRYKLMGSKMYLKQHVVPHIFDCQIISYNEDEKSDSISNNIEQEHKVNIEETSINLGCVKREFDEEELELKENRYEIDLNFGNEKRNNIDSLVAFLDDDVIMERTTGCVKLEENMDLIRKSIEQSHCNKCGGNYQGYCLICSSLSHILNSITPNLNPDSALNTIPINILEIREVSKRQAVFALQTLPKGIILGPFEGIGPIKSTTGLQWKIKDKKFDNDQNGNWMKYIESVANHEVKNLDVFQIDGILYFETSREIQEGEELVVCYGVEEVLKSNKEEEFYLVPVKKEGYPKVFACTLCCLGFRLERCLVEHKSRCPQGDHDVNIQDFEITQCRCCKVWLEKQEHQKSHMLRCLDNYKKLSHNMSGVRPTNTSDEIPSVDVNASYSTPPKIDSKYSCGIDYKTQKKDYFHIGVTHSSISGKTNKHSEYSHQTNHETNLEHRNTHSDIKPVECGICKKKLARKSSLKLHIRNQHSNPSEMKYKCSECSFQTKYKASLDAHLNTHSDIKSIECGICKKKLARKSYLKLHIRNQHSNPSEMKYKCSECSFQTKYKASLEAHLNIHSDIKSIECGICKKRLARKSYLKLHIRNQHSNPSEMKYKCSKCSFQTKYKDSLEGHLNTHSDIKPIECGICKKRLAHKSSLILHIRNQHSNPNEKKYKCTECSYQTNYESNLTRHIGTHNDIKSFECGTCKRRFGQKSSLQLHIRIHHSNANEEKYKCSECPYQTNYKGNLKMHLSTHNDTKPFECGICKKRFGLKSGLKLHIRDQHSNANEKKYKCSECPYQTNYKTTLRGHLNAHNGIKPFECDICKKRFTLKQRLNQHIKNQHSNTIEKISQYKCSECSYRTKYKTSLKLHLNTHKDIKSFQCDICKKKFRLKANMRFHIKDKHSNVSKKEYKCLECCYKTYSKYSFKYHLNTHNDIKPFECDICKKGFTEKTNLKLHFLDKHSNTSEKKYKCSECSYQTNRKGNLQMHFNTHKDI